MNNGLCPVKLSDVYIRIYYIILNKCNILLSKFENRKNVVADDRYFRDAFDVNNNIIFIASIKKLIILLYI